MQLATTGRNDPCPCGSGKKFKKCCIGKAQSSNAGLQQTTYKNAQLLNQAITFFKANNFSKAEELAKSILATEPDNDEVLHLVASILVQSGNAQEAEHFIRRAIQINSEKAHFYNTLGIILSALKRYEESCIAYGRAIKYKPNDSNSYNNMGVSFMESGRPDQALICYNKSIELDQKFAKPYMNAGLILSDMGKYFEAMHYYKKASELSPNDPLLCNNLGSTLHKAGRYKEAALCLEAGLKLENISDEVKKAIWTNLCSSYRDMGDYEKTISEYNKLVKAFPSPGLRVELACMLPAIIPSEESIDLLRQKIITNLDNLEKNGLKIENIEKEISNPLFYQAYHGRNDKDLVVHLANFFKKVCPSLSYKAPHCEDGAKRKEGKIRVGVISAYFHRHVVSKFYNEFLSRLASDERLELTAFAVSAKRDDYTEKLQESFKEYVFLSASLDKSREIIAERQMDFIFYPDLGMNTLPYFLAFAKLAPIQATAGGHPITSGIRNMDYYISVRDLESENAQEHYSEKLVLFDHNTGIFSKPAYPDAAKTRDELGLPDGKLYMCPVMLHKLHPSLDGAFKKILEKDKEGKIILFGPSKQNILDELLKKRLSELLDEKQIERIKFMPFAIEEDFIYMLKAADVILDPFVFSMGTTAFITLGAGVPVITLPGEFMRGRCSYWLYKRMGFTDLCAEDVDDYVNIAARFANDSDFSNRMKQLVKERSHLIYDDYLAVPEMAEFIESKVNEYWQK